MSGGEAAEGTASFDDPLDPRRAHMLTASRFGEALGLSRYHGPVDLWKLLTGRTVDERGESAACAHGHTTEAEARALYSARCAGALAHRMRARGAAVACPCYVNTLRADDEEGLA